MDPMLIEDIEKGMSAPSREGIKALEEALDAFPQEMKVTPPTQHFFAKGAYMRAITLKKGIVVTSKIHKTQHISVVLKGDVTIAKADGTKERVQGPHIFITEPNTKRAIIVHEDTEWVTFHVTDKTDLAEIEEEIIAKDYV